MSTITKSFTANHLSVLTLCFDGDREFQYGGDGSTGLARHRGACTACFLRNLEASRTDLIPAKLWMNL